MRLIDADALKKALNFVYNCDYIGSKSKEGIASDIIDAIDNAPTVEVPENAVNCVLTMFGKCSYNKTGCSDCEIKDKIRKALKERPQGEWINVIYTNNGCGVGMCNQCSMHKSIDNFCPNCGADMRGGAE